ncbi:MAG: hypothetical protein U1E87_06955 [Alphaproteobacteria bacterium]
MRRALAWFEDGHTTVLPFELTGGVPDKMKGGAFGGSLPIPVRVFHDGLFVTRATGEGLPLLGLRIASIAGTPIETAVAASVASWSGENPAWGHIWSWLLLTSTGLLEGLGFLQGTGPSLPVVAAGADGAAVSALLGTNAGDPKGFTDLAGSPTPPESLAKAAGRGNYVRAIPEHRALYVSLDEMGDLEGYPAEKLTADIVAAMSVPSIKRLVVDLRRNGGGDNYAGEALRREIARSRFNAWGSLYVLTSPHTFSAAQNLASRIERETLAIIVGEPTGSAPNMHGDAKPFTGPATGITAIVSTLRWYDGGPHDKRRWIFPDLFVPSTFADWRSGTDRALETALTHTPDKAVTFEERAFYFDRPSQKQEWRPFWRTA